MSSLAHRKQILLVAWVQKNGGSLPKDNLSLSYNMKWECWSGFIFSLCVDWFLENDFPFASR